MEMWLVTTGEYSDYSVLCACPTEDLAKSIGEAISDDGYHGAGTTSVVLYTKMPVIVDQLNISGEVDPEDDSWSGRETHSRWIEGDRPAKACEHSVSVSTSYLSNNRRDVVHIGVWGADHERVRKVFSEQLAQARAEAPLLVARSQIEDAQREAKYLKARVADLTKQKWAGTIGS